MSSKPIMFRVTGPKGTTRVKLSSTETLSALYTAAEAELGMAARELTLSKDLPGHDTLVRGSTSFKQAGLMHGDQVFIQTGVTEYMAAPAESAMEVDEPSTGSPVRQVKHTGNSKTFRIDDIPDEEQMGVQAKYTPTLAYVQEALLKHNRGQNKAHPFVDVGIDGVDYTAHQGFNSFKKPDGHTRLHLRDAPKSVILTGQKHRHLDNLQMADNGGLRNFITAWQNAGMAEQCMAFLYGEYQSYDAFEHGAKAVVHALYEPPQQGQVESFTILPDPTNEHAERVARMLGLCRVGWALTAGGRTKTDSPEPFKRLSASELAAAAHFQEKTQLRNNGRLTPISRFVSLLVQPDSDSTAPGMAASVEPLAFQATDQAVALHRDKILERPHKLDFCSVRKPVNSDDFVAPVIYQGVDVHEVDVDFLQLDITVTVSDGSGSGCLFARNTFPTRLFLKREASINELKNEFRRYSHLAAHEMLSDFNLLVFLASLESLKDHMQSICDCVRTSQPLSATAIAALQPYMAAPSSSPGATATASGSAPSEAESTLMAMGYTREQAHFALDACGGDVNNAVNILLNQ
eukprot:TRINITY_DN2072_c0_g1_i2.p1 TRINITY_DN2072_c0_g1~~TRINITY_DN2072_c0_g1_i2.p1  ORF type:complete len:575 (+),score=152.59 TRINITY_DN2072_c0_g1_i2:82-1806(+)